MLPAPQALAQGLVVWADPESRSTHPRHPLVQGLGVCGFPFSPDLFWACSAPSQAGKGAEARGGRRVARRKPEEAGGGRFRSCSGQAPGECGQGRAEVTDGRNIY